MQIYGLRLNLLDDVVHELYFKHPSFQKHKMNQFKTDQFACAVQKCKQFETTVKRLSYIFFSCEFVKANKVINNLLVCFNFFPEN